MAREKLSFTTPQKILEIASAAFLAAFLISIAMRYADLPDTLPMHYNMWGEIDRWADKSELLVLPIMTAILFAGMTLIECFPGIWNMPVGEHDAHRAQVQNATRTMLIILKIVIIGTFGYMTDYVANQKELPAAFLPVDMLALALPIILYLVYVRTIKRKTND